MKFLILIFCSLYLTTEPAPQNDTETYYYFCYSRSKDLSDSISNQVLLHTEIKTIICETEYFSILSSDWHAFVESHCGNTKGCSSDLNHYTTFELAESRLNNILDRYRKYPKYQIIKVDF